MPENGGDDGMGSVTSSLTLTKLNNKTGIIGIFVHVCYLFSSDNINRCCNQKSVKRHSTKCRGLNLNPGSCITPVPASEYKLELLHKVSCVCCSAV